MLRLDPSDLNQTRRTELNTEGGKVTFSGLFWSGGRYALGNGAAIDMWNDNFQAVCFNCLFNYMWNEAGGDGAGVVHLEWGSLELRGCDFNQCRSPRGGVVHIGVRGGDCTVDDCLFENCESKPAGGIIWVPTSSTGLHSFSLTNSEFLRCKVRSSENANAVFGPLIVCHSIKDFTFDNNNFTWSDGQQVMTRCTMLLEVADYTPDTEIVISNCVIANTDMPEGIVKLFNETKSFTYRNLSCARVKCGTDTYPIGFLPDGQITDKLLLDECHFAEDSGASQAFLDSAVFEGTAPAEFAVTGCTFSKCKCNHTAFLDVHDSQTVKIADCTFNNIRFDGSVDQPRLLHVDHCGNSNIEGINFHLPKMSSDPMSLSFTNGDFTFTRCSFLVDGGKNNEVELGTSAKSRFDSCVFTVDNYNGSSSELVPLLTYEGVGTNSELVFYNCCFTHVATDLESTVPLYMDLEGHGNAKFESACFDVAKNLAMRVAQGIKPIFDREEIMFGDCECTIFLPPETFESLVPEETTPPPVPTRTEEGAKKADVGLITGTFFGILLLLAILILLILFLLWRRKRKQESTTEPPPPVEDEPEETVTLTESGDAFDGATNDNPLFAHDLSTQDIFGNQFEEQSNFLTS